MICEYWNDAEGPWVMEDVDLQIHDLSPQKFITGARAWQMCREDSSKGNLFGWGPDMYGVWAARVNLVRDFAALNGFESISGDEWGLTMTQDAQLTDEDITLLDTAAALAITDDIEERRALYKACDRLSVPTVLHHFDYILNH